MAEKMLSKVLWGPASSASKKCVTELDLVTVGWGLVSTRPQQRLDHVFLEISGQEGKARKGGKKEADNVCVKSSWKSES